MQPLYGLQRRSAAAVVSDLGARPRLRPTCGGHRDRARCSECGRASRERRKIRSGHGNDGGQRWPCCRWRTGPSRSRARAAGARASRTSATAASTSTAPSAPAATAARSSPPPIARSSASTATRARSPRGAGLVAGGQRPADPGRGPLFRSRPVSRANAAMRAVDGVVLDIGVSSMQLDEAERGFSFRLDGPLDMRMGGDGPSAADVVAHGVRARSRRHHLSSSARSGTRAPSPAPSSGARARRRSTTTPRSPTSSAAWCARKPDEIHPATRTFQALRIFVNEELGELAAALAAAERILKPGGRLVVVIVPFARRPHRQDVPRRAQPHARRLAPSARQSSAPAPTLHAADQAPGRRRRRRDRRAIRAPARPSCAPPSARDAPRA